MKNGFTLVELLGVIIILGVIALITMPILTNTIGQSEEKSYKKQINLIENSAREWGVENIDLLPREDSTIGKAISLNTLIDSGKIQNSTIQDPRTGEEMQGCVVVKYNSEYQQYEYKYSEDNAYCDSVIKTCTLVSGTANVVGSKYTCNLGDVNRNFYILEVGTSPVGNDDINLKQDEVALILEGNYDKTTKAAQKNATSSSLDNIAKKWTRLERSQIVLHSAYQLATVLKNLGVTHSNKNKPVYGDLINAVSTGNAITDMSAAKWLYDYPGNDSWGKASPWGYWTATPDTNPSQAWYVMPEGKMVLNPVANNYAIRPVIIISNSDLYDN